VETKQLAVKERGACEMTGIGRSKLLELAYAGVIPSYKVGRSRLFPVAELEKWVQDQVNAARTNEVA
jgi:excisionase family DNA binding protein